MIAALSSRMRFLKQWIPTSKGGDGGLEPAPLPPAEQGDLFAIRFGPAPAPAAAPAALVRGPLGALLTHLTRARSESH